MTHINLIPARRLDAMRHQRHARRWYIGGGLYAVLILAVCIIVHSTRGEAQAVARQLSDITSQSQNLQLTLDAAHKDLSSAQSARETLAVLADPPNWSTLFDCLSALTADDTLLREIHVTPAAGAATALDQPRGYILSIHGLSLSQTAVSQFVQRLGKCDLFSEVKLVKTNREPYRNTAAVSFDVECAIGDAALKAGGRP